MKACNFRPESRLQNLTERAILVRERLLSNMTYLDKGMNADDLRIERKRLQCGEEKIHYREIKIVMRIKSRQRSITTSYRPLIRSLSNCRENSAACYIGIAERSLSTNRARSLRNEMN